MPRSIGCSIVRCIRSACIRSAIPAITALFVLLVQLFASASARAGYFESVLTLEGTVTGYVPIAGGEAYYSGLDGGNSHGLPVDLSVNGYLAGTASSTGALGYGKTTLNGGKVVLTMTWKPNGNNATLDPPPSKVAVAYSAEVTARGSGFIDPGTPPSEMKCKATITVGAANASIDIYHLSSVYVMDEQEDHDTVTKTEMATVTNGVAVKKINFSWETEAGSIHPNGGGGATIEYRLGLAVNGRDIGRFGGVGGKNGGLNTALTGRKGHSAQDPSFTRWLPLAFVPTIDTQPFRLAANNTLEKPWGNMNCAYSIYLRRELHPDINGAGNYYDKNNRKITSNTKGTEPGYVITDVNGDRLTFGPNFATKADDIKCDVTTQLVDNDPNNPVDPAFPAYLVALTNAGPPGRIKERGEYTYTFDIVPDVQTTGDAAFFARGRLLTISDKRGNIQTLDYNYGGSPAPYVVVSDSSSGRKLFFYKHPTTGYMSSVVAPASVSPVVAAVTTQLDYDSTGHLKQLDVYLGAYSTTAPSVRREVYTYTNDQLLSVQSGGVLQGNTYNNSQSKDIFGSPIQRLGSTTLGLATDTTSSDVTGASIAGTVTYNLGVVRNSPDQSYSQDARTNYITDARGGITTLLYHYENPDTGADNGLISGLDTTRPAFTGATQPYTVLQRFVPDMVNPQTTTTIDGNGNSWVTTHDQTKGRPLTISDPLSHTTTFTWGGALGSELASVTDATGVTRSFSYDSTHGSRLTEVKDNNQAVRSAIVYNSFGQPETVTVPAVTHASGVASTVGYTYNSTTGDISRVTNPDGSISVVGDWDIATRALRTGTASYDPLGDPLAFTVFPDTGNPQTSTQPLYTFLTWNAAQQVTQTQLPTGLRLTNIYNDQGQVTESRALAFNNTVLAKTAYSYDSRGRVYKVDDLVGTTAQFRYDKNSNLRKVIDGKGNVTDYAYGPNNELTQVTSAGGKTHSFLYDKGGRVRQATDTRGVVHVYTYDAAGRLSSVALPAYTGETVSYTYDNADRLLSVSKPNGDSVTFAYNHINKWLTDVTTTVSGRTHTVNYTYYPDGHRQSMTTTAPGGGSITSVSKTTTYEWDVNGRLKKTIVPGFGTTQWGYDFIGRMLSQTTTTPTANTFGTEYLYGNSGRTGDTSTAPAFLSSILHTRDGNIDEEENITYSELGQVTNLNSERPGTSEEFAVQYTHNLRGQITQESYNWVDDQATPGSSSRSYSYDAAGNLNGGTNGWAYNSDNQLTSAPTVGGMPGASGLTYDSAGYLTNKNGMTLSYDPWGRLSSVNSTISPTGTTYTYDPLGRRFSSVTNSFESQTRYFFDYDGSTLVGVRNEWSGLFGLSVGYTHYHWGVDGVIGDSFVQIATPGPPGGPIGDGSTEPDLFAPFSAHLQGGGSGEDARYYSYDATGALSATMARGAVAGAAASVIWARPAPESADRSAYGYVGSNPYASGGAMVGNGVYQMPDGMHVSPAGGGLSGNYAPGVGMGIDDEGDDLGNATSYGGFYGAAFKKGWAGITGMPQWQPGSAQRRNMSGIVQAVPVAGNAYTGYTVLTGYDPIAGACLSTFERTVNGVGLGLGALGHLADGAAVGAAERAAGSEAVETAVAAKAVASAAEETAGEAGQTLYRGVTNLADRPDIYEAAVRGIAKPRGGNATPYEHAAGNTNSEFTSWTVDYAFSATKWAMKAGGNGGVVLKKTFSPSDLIETGHINSLLEGESLVEGIIKDCEVIHIW